MIYYVIRKKVEFIFLIPLFNAISDTSFAYFEGFSAPTFLRAGVLLLFLILSKKYLTWLTIGKPFLWFFLYVLLMTFFSNELSYSIKGSFQILLSMALFLAGYGYINCYSRYDRLMKSLVWVIIFSVAVTAAGYIFGIGKALEYTTTKNYEGEAEKIGLLGSGGLYAPAVLLAAAPVLVRLNFNFIRKWILYLSMLLLYIFIILNVRRTAILIPIIGTTGFLMFYKFRRKIIKYVLLAILAIFISFPLYSDYLIRRFELREAQGRFEEDFYKTEARYLENVEMMEKIINFDEPLKIIFGIGNNIFAEHIENGIIVKRMYHSDSAKLFYGVGLFGIFLYLIIYFRLFVNVFKIPTKGILIELKALALGLILTQLFISINGSVTLISFRSITFLLIGAAIGFSHSILKSNGSVLDC